MKIEHWLHKHSIFITPHTSLTGILQHSLRAYDVTQEMGRGLPEGKQGLEWCGVISMQFWWCHDMKLMADSQYVASIDDVMLWDAIALLFANWCSQYNIWSPHTYLTISHNTSNSRFKSTPEGTSGQKQTGILLPGTPVGPNVFERLVGYFPK